MHYPKSLNILLFLGYIIQYLKVYPLSYIIITSGELVNRMKYSVLLIGGCSFLLFLLCTPDERTGDADKAEIVVTEAGYVDPTEHSLMAAVTTVILDMQNLFPEESIPDPSLFGKRIDSLSRELKKRRADVFDSPVLIDTIIRVIYHEWKIVFDPDQNNLQSLLPHTVITRKKGSCLGVSLLFLLISEKLEFPLYGVLLPGHFFVRYDDGEVYRNIEPNRHGYHHPLEYYRLRYAVLENHWYTLKNLSIKETAAVLYYNCANICAKNGKHNAARQYYHRSIEGLEGFAEAWGNCAILYASDNMNDSARLAFDKAFTLNPKLEGLSQNIGAFELGLNRCDAAKNAYRNGLSHSPDDPDLLYGMAYTWFSLAKPDSALFYLSQIGIPKDSTTREYKLAQLINEKQRSPKK